MNAPRALWIPFEVKDIDVARAFYVDRLGLSESDRWSHPDERGVVLTVGPSAFIELVSSRHGRRAGPPPLAFELATSTDVDAAYTVMAHVPIHRPPARYPRGHYGFEVGGPADTTVMVWAEQ